MLLIIRDISERLRSEAEKESQRLFLETLVNNIPARVTIKDREGRYTFISVGENHTSEELKASEQLIGKTSESIFGEEAYDRIEKYSKSVFETGEPVLGVERTGERLVFEPAAVVVASHSAHTSRPDSSPR